mgnify:CR=1 FL=1
MLIPLADRAYVAFQTTLLARLGISRGCQCIAEHWLAVSRGGSKDATPIGLSFRGEKYGQRLATMFPYNPRPTSGPGFLCAGGDRNRFRW